MGYVLHALVCDASDVARATPSGAVAVALSQGKALVPLTTCVCQAHRIGSLMLSDQPTASDTLVASISALVGTAHRVAYVEAEYFGGVGSQAAAVLEDGRSILGPIVARDAIDQALRLLGVVAGDHRDEFDALGLGHHRDTHDWA